MSFTFVEGGRQEARAPSYGIRVLELQEHPQTNEQTALFQSKTSTSQRACRRQVNSTLGLSSRMGLAFRRASPRRAAASPENA